VVDEFDYSELYAPVDLKIGHCRLSVAAPQGSAPDGPASHVRVATKYPATTRRWYEAHGVQAECVKLNGAMEIAPRLGLATHIVDLVSSGQTLKDNGLVEESVIAEVSARLIVNRAAFKLRAGEVPALVERFRQAVG
jgi:ATP phosphoribosyltransferase